MTLQALRVVVLHGLAMLGQTVLASPYLQGDADSINAHRINANIVSVLGIAQLVCDLGCAWAGAGRSRDRRSLRQGAVR